MLIIGNVDIDMFKVFMMGVFLGVIIGVNFFVLVNSMLGNDVLDVMFVIWVFFLELFVSGIGNFLLELLDFGLLIKVLLML